MLAIYKSSALAIMVDGQFLFPRDTLKEAEGSWDVWYTRVCLYRRVEVQSVLCLILPQ